MNLFRGLGVSLLIIPILSACGGSGDTTDASAKVPAVLQNVTLRQLYEESVANLARYDDLYRGKWFQVTGTVDFMFDYKVVVDAGPGDGDVIAILTDVPRSDQIPLNNGDPITARCQISDVIGYGVNMENCSLK